MTRTPKSFDLVYRYTYNHVAQNGFPTSESAQAYNEKYFRDTEGTLGVLCHVVPNYYDAPYRNEKGDVA